jgi:hypothetical protein
MISFWLLMPLWLVLTLLVLGLCIHVTLTDHFQRKVSYFLLSVKSAFPQYCSNNVVDNNKTGDFVEGGFVLGHESEVVKGGFGDTFAVGGQIVHEFTQPAFFMYFLFERGVEIGVGSGCFRGKCT